MSDSIFGQKKKPVPLIWTAKEPHHGSKQIREFRSFSIIWVLYASVRRQHGYFIKELEWSLLIQVCLLL